MKRIALFSFVLISFFLILFFLSPFIGLDFSGTEAFMKSNNGLWAALAGVGLLIIDFFLPVPSSLIMIYHGVLFGPVWGAVLSVIGGMGATFTGYYAGKKGQTFLLRFIPQQDIEQSAKFFERWGLPIIAITRPVPLLSEAIAVVAGMSKVKPMPMALYSLLGLIPSSVIYSLAGAYALDIEGGIVSFLTVIGISAAGWLISSYFQKKLQQTAS
ncbi:MAG: TVP38/TMEM64 family protein [Bacteroidetes bacterium]|nr:MAG: TVP38/TMEM64 family protein [Bacteroidota bacterium]